MLVMIISIDKSIKRKGCIITPLSYLLYSSPVILDTIVMIVPVISETIAAVLRFPINI